MAVQVRSSRVSQSAKLDPILDPYLALFIGLIVGAGACALALRGRLAAARGNGDEQQRLRVQAEADLVAQREQTAAELSQLQAEAAAELSAHKVDRAASESQLRAKLEAAEKNMAERSQQLTDLNGQLEKLRTTYQEQLQKLGNQLADQLGEKFRLHADANLKKQETDFLQRAEQKLKPLDQSLKDLRERTDELEKQRAQAIGSLGQQLHDLSKVTVALRSQSESLATALRGSSEARGQWGETTLRNLVEIAGLVEYCDFQEQSAKGHDGLRPDLLVRLPGKEFIPIDAKVSLAAYMDYVNASDEEEKAAHLAQHAQDVRQHVRTLGGKDYAQHVQGGIDFTVLYLPGDHFLDAAFQRFPQLQEEALAKKVLIATPVTLLALLKTVQLVWRNESVSQDAQKIKDAGVELHSRVRKFAVYLENLGKKLEATTKTYNQATSSFNARLLPKGREITKLIVHGQESEQLTELKEVTAVPTVPVDTSEE